MSFFNLFSIFFIFMFYIQLFRDKKLEFNKTYNTDNISKIDIFYYLFKVFYWIWLPIGYFKNQSESFYLLLIFGILNFIIYHINKKMYIFYNKIIYPVICIMILLYIFLNI